MLNKITVFFIWLITHQFAIGQVENVSVKLESGKTVDAKDVPWLQLADFSYESKSQKSADYDWVVFSPPKFCPFSYYYSYTPKKLSLADRNANQNRCSENLLKKYLSDTPDEVKKYCKCKLILETESPKDGSNPKAVWRSYDDELLMEEGYHVKWSILSKGEKLPVLISISRVDSGIFNFGGEKLCSLNLTKHISESRKIDDMLGSLLKNADIPVPVECLGREGSFDMKKISYSVFQGRIIGTADLNFKNGEKYEIDPK